MDASLLIPDPLNSAMNLHPMFVHFPLALLPLALLFFLLAWWRRGERWLFTAKTCLIAGAIGASIAVITGWFAGASIPHNEAIHLRMETHQYAAILVFIVATILAVWSRWLTLEHRSNLGWFVGALALANGLQLLPREKSGLKQLDTALDRLALAAPQIKKSLLAACVQIVGADGVIQEREAELLRAIADTLDCPIPPFVAIAES